MRKLWFFILLLHFLENCHGDRTSLKIYEKLQSDIFCFRRLNATHQIGCASKSGGNVGVVYIVEEDTTENITTNVPPMPFIVALPINLFNMHNMKKIKNLPNVRGVLILKPDEEVPESFSPDQSCPNRNFGFYTEKLNEEYAACKKKEWNRLPGNTGLGMMFEDWGMPIFVITNQTNIQSIRKCYETFNNGSWDKWPLCSVQLTSVMLAAKDSDTCMRRNKLIANLNEVKTCDPLSDKNIVYSLFPRNKSEEITNGSVIVLSARLDTFSLFDKLAPGAHSTVTGLVTLLAIAKNMADLKKRKGFTTERNILFTIFNGEAFDYIGSSRVVFDMQKGIFPVPMMNDVRDQPAPISLHHISSFVELSQLAPVGAPPTVWLHTDPVSIKESQETADKVKELVSLLTAEAQKSGANLKMSQAPSDLPLPPASFQSFLRHESTIPGVILADHSDVFINKYYNSIFDSKDTVSSSHLANVLANISTAVTGTLYKLLTGEKLDEQIEPSNELISGLLECYLENASCPLFQEIADPLMIERLRVEPYPLYVSVDSGGHTKANAITLYTRYLLAYLTGEEEQQRDRLNCTGDEHDQINHYDWMAGKNASGVCIKSTVMYTMAQSPAYVLNDWQSRDYSTWTESVWLETSARLFVQPGRSQEAVTLICGLIVLLLSVASVYFLNERSSIIFNTKPLC